MKNNDLHQEILKQLGEVRTSLDAVRTQDIPSLKTDLAVFKKSTTTAITELENKTKWSTKLYTIIGGAITVAIVKFTGHQ